MQPVFVTNLDTVSNAESTLLRDFVDSINAVERERHDERILQEPVLLSEFSHMVRRALGSTKIFHSQEIEEIIQFFKNPNKSLLVNTSPEQHLLAKRSGLPSAEFVQNLKAELAATRPSVNLRSYPLSLTPTFYTLLLTQIPSLKDDIDDSLLCRLSREYARTPLPHNDAQSTNHDRVLTRIKRNTIQIAQLLESQPPTRSLLAYSRDHTFPERLISQKVVTAITRTKGKGLLIDNLTERVVNCNRCPATISLTTERNFKPDRHSDIPAHLQMINIHRLQPHTGLQEILTHYKLVHLKFKHSSSQTFAQDTCSLLVPCKICVTQFLATDKTSVSVDDHLFFCCISCSEDHVNALHGSDNIFKTLASSLRDSYPHSTKFLETVHEKLNVQCFCCLELFDSFSTKRKHQLKCFSRFASLTSHFAEKVNPSFFDSPFLKEKRRIEEKAHARAQLARIAATLHSPNMSDEDTPNQPSDSPTTPDLPDTEPRSTQRWQFLARQRIKDMTQELRDMDETPSVCTNYRESDTETENPENAHYRYDDGDDDDDDDDDDNNVADDDDIDRNDYDNDSDNGDDDLVTVDYNYPPQKKLSVSRRTTDPTPKHDLKRQKMSKESVWEKSERLMRL